MTKIKSRIWPCAFVLALFVTLSLGGCEGSVAFLTGDQVTKEEIVALEAKLEEAGDEAGLARKEVFDIAAHYEVIQQALHQAVLNPDIPSDLKADIKEVDAEVTGAIVDYNNIVKMAGTNATVVSSRLSAAFVLIGRAQFLLVRAVAQNLVPVSE